jgi:acyl carrier protein
MDTEKRELWDRLENEPERAYRAFECFLGLPSGERTLLEAYRRHVGNPDAAKPSDTWSGWSSSFAWRQRAAAYDDHLASVRRDAYERAVEEEAEKQAREVEQARGRYNELMTLGYECAVEWLENAQASDLRAQDVLAIIRLYMDAEKAFGVKEPSTEAEWTEEDERDVADIVKEIDALTDLERLEEGGGPEEGSGEDQSEESEDDSESVDDDTG